MPYVAGQFVWAGFDYLGEAGPWPSKGMPFNLISMTGFRKPFSYYWQSLYLTKPMVRIAVDNSDSYKDPKKYADADWNGLVSQWVYPADANWTALVSQWTFPEDIRTLRVYTFTNAPRVGLLLNGKSLGEKRLKDYGARVIKWDVPNQPGTIEAIAKNESGETVATHELKTPGKALRLVLLPDRTRLAARGEDLSFIEARVEDSNGVVVPNAPALGHFSLSGPGLIAGVDSRDLDDPEPFQSNQRETREGRCLVIVQSTRVSGVIQLVAHADGLEDGSVEIEAQADGGPPILAERASSISQASIRLMP